MKTKYSNSRLSYFSTPRIHGNVFAWNKPVSQAKPGRQLPENIQRWEDDGGPVSEIGTPLHQAAETKTPRLMDIGSGTS